MLSNRRDHNFGGIDQESFFCSGVGGCGRRPSRIFIPQVRGPPVRYIPWDNCLDACGKDISANKLCKKPVFLPKNSTIQPSPSQQSVKFRTANIVKNPGNTVYGRWSRAKYNPKTRKYTMLNGARTTY